MENSKENNILRPNFTKNTKPSNEEGFVVGGLEEKLFNGKIYVTSREGTKIFDLNKKTEKIEKENGKVLPFVRKKQLTGV